MKKFHIIQSTMGFAGDEENDIIEAESAGIAEEEKLEELQQRLEAFCVESFETEEEAEQFIEEL